MIRAVVACVLLAGCKSGGEPSDLGEDKKPGATRGSEGGFSAGLSADLAGPRSNNNTGSGSDMAAVLAEGPRTTNSSEGSGAAGSAPPPAAGSASGSASKAGSASPPASAGSAASGSGAGSAKVAAGSAAGSGSAVVMVAPPPVKMSPELAAIKLSLLPNWDRDVEEAGTISLNVNVQSSGSSQRFKFYYGYDDPKAPADREAYKKYLGEAKLLAVAADRQRGAAWYLEGTGAGGPAFRMQVIYGGKRLVCGGSLYKDSTFGDIRDEVVIQAKKICETIQL